MAFVEKYLSHYDYVPFKHNWYVDCKPKKRLLKNSQVDSEALAKLSLIELQQVVNPRNVDEVEKIIKQKLKEQERLLKASQQYEYAKKQAHKKSMKASIERNKHIAKKRTMQLLDGLACAPRYSTIYA